jgi:hypothetical protein
VWREFLTGAGDGQGVIGEHSLSDTKRSGDAGYKRLDNAQGRVDRLSPTFDTALEARDLSTS